MEEAVKETPAEHGTGHGPKYFVNIEGTIHDWSSPTITTEQLAQLGGWDPAIGVIEIDPDNNERTLAPGEVVELKPGHGFAKKVRWKRGDSVFEARLELEMLLLKGHFGAALVREGTWFLVPDYAVGAEGWNREKTAVSFRAQVGYPGTPPYGIFVPAGIRFNGAMPQNYQEPVGERPPFPGEWGLFSWGPDDGQWRPGSTPREGSNLLNFALSFANRFRQGA
jgi:hypothetical protein